MLLLFGCDSAAPNAEPAIVSVTADPSVLRFLPNDAVPSASISVAATDSDSEGLTYEWQASGGQFESTGTQQVPRSAARPMVRWQPDPIGGLYTVAVTVSDGNAQVVDSTQIEVRPSAFGNWFDEIELSGEVHDRATLCMWISSGEKFETYDYGETREGNNGIGSGGGMRESDYTYEYPNLSATLDEPDSDDADEPVSLTGTLSADGTVFQIDVELESGTTRRFEMERQTFYCQQ